MDQNVSRLKAVLRTNEGWFGYNFSGQEQDIQPSGYRRDSRIEIIVNGPLDQAFDDAENELRDCLLTSEST